MKIKNIQLYNLKIKRPILLFLCVFLIGIINGVATKDKGKVWNITLMILVAAFFCCAKRYKNRKKCSVINIIKTVEKRKVIICLMCLFVFIVGTLRFRYFEEMYMYAEEIGDDTIITIDGIATDISKSQFGYIAKIYDGTFYYYIYSEQKFCDAGEFVCCTGTKKEMKISRNYGNFDEKEYMHSEGVALCMKLNDYKIYSDEKDIIRRYTYQIRDTLCDKLEELSNGKNTGILKAILFGDKEDLDKDVKELYQVAGIAHILVVSGLHISAIGMVIYKVLRRKLSLFSASIISGTMMVMFGYVAGQGISTRRAVIMYAISLIANIVGKKYDMISSASLAALLMLFSNPYYIFNFSFLMSFACIIAIAVFGKIWILFVISNIKINSKYIKGIITSFVMSFSIFIVSAPIMAYSYFEISLLSVFINLLVLPIMSLFLIAGLSAVLVGFVSTSIGIIIISFDNVIIGFLDRVCIITTSLFGRITIGRPYLLQIIIYYFVIAVFTKYILHKLKIKRQVNLHNSKSMLWKGTKVICAFLFLFVILINILFLNRDKDFLMSIDVGQGECMVVSYNGNIVMFDSGSSDVKNVGENRVISALKARGIDKIDAVFISHTDSDHVNGVKELVLKNSIEIEKIYIGNTLETYESRDDFVREMKQNNKTIECLEYGDVVKVGDITCEVLDTGITGGYKKTDINAESMVIICSIGEFDIFNGGDITIEQEKVLCEKYNDRLKMIEIYKCSHHGSDTANSELIIGLIKPYISIISCGQENSYGHPSKSVINTLKKYNIQILNTKADGEIFLEIK